MAIAPTVQAASVADAHQSGCFDAHQQGRSVTLAIEKEADRDRAIVHGHAVFTMGENLKLVDQLDELTLAAKAWPPTARSFFCEAFDTLATIFCAPLAGVP